MIKSNKMENLESVSDSKGNVEILNENKNGYIISIPYNKKEKSNDFPRFIKTCENMIRTSKEYSAYIAYLKNDVGLRNCMIFSKISDEEASIEMHHGPIFTLFDICEIVSDYIITNVGYINSSIVSNQVLEDHWDNIIQVVMLCKTAHKGLMHCDIKEENSKSKQNRYFLNVNRAWGDFKKFCEKYALHFDRKHLFKINKYQEMLKKYGNEDSKFQLKQEITLFRKKEFL